MKHYYKTMLIREEKINDNELMKKTMTKKKSTLPSLRKQDWKKIKTETEKFCKLL